MTDEGLIFQAQLRNSMGVQDAAALSAFAGEQQRKPMNP
jgi:hypothetical protein